MKPAADDIDLKHRKLRHILGEMGRVLVAFSGGVDSTLLLKIAGDVLPGEVLAVTAVSETLPGSERAEAAAAAKAMGVPHLVVESREMDNPEFVKNPPDKCYLCKRERFGQLAALAAERGCGYVLDGENRDDRNDYRPGSRASRELGVRSPLSEAGFTKADVRRLSRQLELPTWDKPANACLASRIPYHQPITPSKLNAVERSEAFLRKLGLSPLLRVRHHGDVARLELSPGDITKVAGEAMRQPIVDHFRSLGFKHIAVDLEGYAMGSLNRAIDPEEHPGT